MSWQAVPTWVARPVGVGRSEDVGWRWVCRMCPPPLGQRPILTGSWQAAMDEAGAHIRVWHGQGWRWAA